MNKIYILVLLVFSANLSLKGQIIFSRTFGDTSVSESAVSMVRTADNGYVLLGSKGSYDIFLVKTDSAGTQIWSKTIHDSTHYYFPDKITELPGGDLVIVGRKELSTTIFWNNFVMKTDSAGNIKWENSYFPLFDYQTCRSVKTTSDGNLIITGSCSNATGFSHTPFTAKLDTSGAVIWSNFDNEFEPFDIVELNDGSFMSAGYNCGICTSGSHEVMVAKFDSSGTTKWVRLLGLPGINDEWHFISKTLSGDVVVCGTVDSIYNPNIGLRNTNIHVEKLDTAGTILWSNIVHLPFRDIDGEIVETADSIFHLTGIVQNVFYGSTTYSNETTHMQFDKNGNLLCYNFFNPRYSSGSAIVLSSDQKLMIAGYVQHDSMNSPDMLLQKIEPACCVPPAPFSIQSLDTLICTGDTFMLTINQPANTTVSWYNGGYPGTITTNDSLQVPPPNSGDFYVVMENQCSAVYSPLLKLRIGNIIAPLVFYSLSPSTIICAGDSVSLWSQFSQSSLTLPHWMHDGVEFAQGVNGNWVKDSGDYWLTAYTRCDTVYSDTVHVSVLTAAPSVPSLTSSDSTLCGGTTSVLLSTDPCTGCVYHWYDETGAYTETDSAFLEVSIPHLYSVTVINPCDSASSLDSVIIEIGTLLVAPVITQNFDTLFSSYPTGNQWLFNSVVIPGATDSFYIPQHTGFYYVSYTESGCEVQSQAYNFLISDVAEIYNSKTFEVNQEEDGSIFIKSFGTFPLQSVVLYAIDGRRELIIENIHSSVYRLTLPSELPGGIYILRLENGNETFSVKVFLKD